MTRLVAVVFAVAIVPLIVDAKIVVQMTDAGFAPHTITIAAGETVVFENAGQEHYWPASNPHPVHTLDAEFDPRHPVLPSESWSYTFSREGEWRFHDHLAPEHMGTIFVASSGAAVIAVPVSHAPGIWSRFVSAITKWWRSMTSRTTSLGKITFAYTDPSSEQLTELYKEWRSPCMANDFGCAARALTQITATQGPRVASAFLRQLQQDHLIDRTVDDHQLMHRIGRETARAFGETGDAFRMCPMSDFNGGCQHGFFEHVLGAASGATEAAEKICGPLRDIASSKVYFDCYHGVGHGVMMAQAYDLGASLAICDQLSDPVGQDGCWQGVFMENVNGALTGAARPGVFSDTDPMQPCRGLAAKYQHECYVNHFGWLMRVTANSVSRASRACLTIADQEKNACLQSIGLAASNPSWQGVLTSTTGSEAERAWVICQEFPKAVVDQCIIGAIDNRMNFDQFNTARSAELCALIPTSLEDVCYRQIGTNIKRQATTSTDIRALCNALPGKAACIKGAGI